MRPSKVRQVLKRVEWEGRMEWNDAKWCDSPTCPSCGGFRPEHEVGCLLVAALNESAVEVEV